MSVIRTGTLVPDRDAMKKVRTSAIILCIAGVFLVGLGHGRADTLIWRYGMSSVLWGMLLFSAILAGRHLPLAERISPKRLAQSYLLVVYALAVAILLYLRATSGFWYYTNPVKELFDFVLLPFTLPFFGLAAIIGATYSSSVIGFLSRALVVPAFLAVWYGTYRILFHRVRRAASAGK